MIFSYNSEVLNVEASSISGVLHKYCNFTHHIFVDSFAILRNPIIFLLIVVKSFS